MERGDDLDDCLSTPEAGEMASKISNERKSALPKPGEVDFINGGPPCQVCDPLLRFLPFSIQLSGRSSPNQLLLMKIEVLCMLAGVASF